MKSAEMVSDMIDSIVQKMALKKKVLSDNDLLQYSGRLRALEWVIDDSAYPKEGDTLSQQPKIEQVIDAVHKE